MAKKVTLTRDDFLEVARKACNKWADKNLKEGASVGGGMAMIHMDYIACLTAELFEEECLKEKHVEEKPKESCDDEAAKEKVIPEMLAEILKAIGAKAEVHVVKIEGK